MIFVGSTLEQPLPPDTEARLASFTELVATAIANAESRAELAGWPRSRRRCGGSRRWWRAGTPPEEVFAAVIEEVGRLLPVDFARLVRYDPHGHARVGRRLDQDGPGADPSRQPAALGGRNATTLVYETGRPARIDYSDASGAIGQVPPATGACAPRSACRSSSRAACGAAWSWRSAAREQPLPPDTEARLASFTELVATAIANAESRAALARLAEEQAALRRVATLVARGAPPEELFAAVIEEIGRLLPVDVANMCRYEPDGTSPFVAAWGRAATTFPVGSRWTPRREEHRHAGVRDRPSGPDRRAMPTLGPAG